MTSKRFILLAAVCLAIVCATVAGAQTTATIGSLPTNASPLPGYFTVTDDGSTHTWKSTLQSVVNSVLGNPVTVLNGGTGVTSPHPAATVSGCGTLAYSGTWPSNTLTGNTLNCKPIYNVASYGASSAASASTNTAAIQAAIDAAESVGGGTVYIPAAPACYAINATLAITSDNVSIVGAGSSVPNIFSAWTPSPRPTSDNPGASCLQWQGAIGGTMLLIKATSSSVGYVARGGVDGVNFEFHNGGGDTPGIAIDIEGAYGMNFTNISAKYFTSEVIKCAGINTPPAVGNCQGNDFENLHFDQGAIANANCILFDGVNPDFSADAAFNVVRNESCYVSGTDTNIYFAASDGDIVSDIQTIPQSATPNAIVFGCSSLSNTGYFISGNANIKVLGSTSCTGGSGTYTQPSRGSSIYAYDSSDNPLQPPTIEPGTTLFQITDKGSIAIPNYICFGKQQGVQQNGSCATGYPGFQGNSTAMNGGCTGTGQTCTMTWFETGFSGSATHRFNAHGDMIGNGNVQWDSTAVNGGAMLSTGSGVPPTPGSGATCPPAGNANGNGSAAGGIYTRNDSSATANNEMYVCRNVSGVGTWEAVTGG